jgi:hypothetical protein
MPVVEEIHVGDIGTVFQVTFYDDSTTVDLSSKTTLQFVFEKPSGATMTKNATFVNDGRDGLASYTTVDGDLDEAGKWRLQGYVVLTGGSWKTSVVTFRVHENL